MKILNLRRLESNMAFTKAMKDNTDANGNINYAGVREQLKHDKILIWIMTTMIRLLQIKKKTVVRQRLQKYYKRTKCSRTTLNTVRVC